MLLSPTVLLSQPTVLVVDDEEAVRRYTSRVMEEAGYHVLTAGDGIQAIRLEKTGVGTGNPRSCIIG